ncbi:hypothetical protein DOY81_006182 [Sarcophaga bullata]|nr:hypothetical protein DOY81_006182 [Sarcophaga bullata]
MFRSLNLWQEPKKVVAAAGPKKVNFSKLLLRTNELFKVFLSNGSWFVYIVAGCVILCCIYYYVHDYKKRLNLRRRRENLQRDNERTPQRRRPGAIYRDHQIFRNAIRTVRQYIGPSELNGSKGKPCVLKRTRSGLIYGSFSDTEDN